MSKRILLYCESQFGVGHYVRSLALARAFRARGWTVGLVSGGTELPGLNPSGITLFHLPRFVSGAPGTILGGAWTPIRTADMQRRSRLLRRMIRSFRPDWFVTEHFPFGRSRMFDHYHEVLEDLNARRRAGSVRIAASVRDVISFNKYTPAHLQGLLAYIRDKYDLVLVHSDPRMISWKHLVGRPNRELPQAFYTGFVAEGGAPLRGASRRLLSWFSRQRRAGRFAILASAGGGREGHPHLKLALSACLHSPESRRTALLVVCGPYMAPAQRRELQAMARGRKHIRVCASVPALGPFFDACDLSISHAGYNTAAHLLSARCQSILVPMPREFTEQNLRAQRLRRSRGSRVILAARLSEEGLRQAIRDARRSPRPSGPGPAVDGADVSVSLVELFERNLP